MVPPLLILFLENKNYLWMEVGKPCLLCEGDAKLDGSCSIAKQLTTMSKNHPAFFSFYLQRISFQFLEKECKDLSPRVVIILNFLPAFTRKQGTKKGKMQDCA